MSYATAVTKGQVKSEAPINTSQVGASSDVVDDDDLDTWIAEAGSELSVISDSHGIDVEDVDTVRVAERAVKAYAIAKLLKTLMLVEAAQTWWEEWESVRDRFEQRIGNLAGDDYAATSTIVSNVDPANPKKRRWAAFDTDRSDGWTGW